MTAASLDGRIVLVTGGGQGIGQATCRALVEHGARVIAADVNDDATAQLAADLGDAVTPVHLDVTSETDWGQAIEKTRATYGHLDGLVNSAGIVKFSPIAETTLADWDQVIAVDQTGTFLGIRAVIPCMVESGGGTIVNISSTSGFQGLAGVISYTAAKFAVRGMTKAAAVELGPLGIRVNSIHPGAVDTAMTRPANTEGWSAKSLERYTSVPLGRMADASEIAQLALFLTSEASSFSTGSEFMAYGGALAGPTRR